MYTPGTILYFTPFRFENGDNPKNKYFIVLSEAEDELLLASLPTSKDHVPHFLPQQHGCINDDARRFNCYCFEAEREITENHFCFPLCTYVYGEQLAEFSIKKMLKSYPVVGADYEIKGRLIASEFKNLKDCLKNSTLVKRKFKKKL